MENKKRKGNVGNGEGLFIQDSGGSAMRSGTFGSNKLTAEICPRSVSPIDG